MSVQIRAEARRLLDAPDETPLPSFRPTTPPPATRVIYKPVGSDAVMSMQSMDQVGGGYVSFLTAQPSTDDAGSLETLAATLGNQSDVEWAVVDEVLHATTIDVVVPPTAAEGVITAARLPDDPQFVEQWGLEAVRAPEAWILGTGAFNESKEVTVCVVDSGIDYTHADLRANIAKSIGISVLPDTTTPMDMLYHGTHVAGIIGAVGNNGVQVSGVAWGNISLLACRFIDGSGYGYTSGAVTCIDYCLQNNARVIQNSWGGSASTNAAMEEAIAAAERAGALFVVSAGNSVLDLDQTRSYPASYAETYDNVIAVASIGQAGQVSSFSNYGTAAVALAAPGESILSTVPGNATATYSGTSMAAPFVSGAAALALSLAGPENLTLQQLKAALLESAELTPELEGRVGAGMLRLDRTIQAALRYVRT